MEPVPETERMEEFRSSPLPSVRMHTGLAVSLPSDPSSPSAVATISAAHQKQYPQLQPLAQSDSLLGSALEPKKPSGPPPSTSPSWAGAVSPTTSSPFYSPPTSSATSFSPFSMASQLPYRPRTTSPLSSHATLGHMRSRSHASSLAPPPMSRTQSMPGFNGAGHVLCLPHEGRPGRPASPSSSRPTSRAMRSPVDECFPPTSPVRHSVLGPERRGSGSASEDHSESPVLGGPANASGTLARHRRPSSPLRFPPHNSSPSLVGAQSAPSSITSSPSTRAIDTFPGSYNSAFFPLSSVPTTPTSARSRSPSISSLETIPDSPGAEEEALEEERIAQLKAAAEAAADGNGDADSKGSRNVDIPPRGRTLSGFGFGSARDKRKRWSVCGAERRGDIDLETIWED